LARGALLDLQMRGSEMMGDFFWNVATSFPSLGLVAGILLAALVVGWFPLLKYLPAIGAYVPAARLVAVLVAALLFFLIGFRIADEREEAKLLRLAVRTKQADLDNSEKSRADEAARAAAIERDAYAQHETDADYIRRLEASDACRFDPFDGMRNGAGAGSGSAPRNLAPAPAGAR
jgi:hypothetical protein